MLELQQIIIFTILSKTAIYFLESKVTCLQMLRLLSYKK